MGTAAKQRLVCSLKQRETEPASGWGSGTLPGEVLAQLSVPFTLLPFHFLQLIMFALIWVFGRRINEQ